MSIDDLAARVRSARRSLDVEAGEARAVAAQGKAIERQVADLKASLERHEKALGVLLTIGESRQESAKAQVESLVTQALQTIFGDDLSFHLQPRTRGNQQVIDFVLRSTYPDGSTVDTSVLDSRGGGMAAVVGFVLRLVVLLLTPNTRRALFLDESFGMVSAEYEPRVAEFLREVADKAAVQVVLITHSSAYSDAADRCYEMTLRGDGSTVAVEGVSR